MSELLEADLTWDGARFAAGLRVSLDGDGRITAVGDARALPGVPRRLEGRALLPGLVNAHSHAFQRGLRGHGEQFPAGAGSFWSWREAMYALVGEMDAARLHALSLQAFREMLAAGITAVGEFHYLHHAGDGHDWELDHAVLAAAREAGIRLVLLQAYYATGDVGRPLEGAQRRFGVRDPAEYWHAWDRLAASAEGPGASLGTVVHSIRAAPLGDLVAVHAESVRRGLVFHMHVEEQRREIEACRAAYGRTPMGVLLDELAPDARFTAVHGTHTRPAELERLLATGANLCVCPLTEANLGDGVPDLAAWGAARDGAGARDQLALGTDSNARIAMAEEMRWLEYAQRLVREERGALRAEDGQLARELLGAATRGGARALGLEAGAIEPGRWADLATLDLAHPSLAGWTPETLLAAWIFGAGNGPLAEVCVGGRWVR